MKKYLSANFFDISYSPSMTGDLSILSLSENLDDVKATINDVLSYVRTIPVKDEEDYESVTSIYAKCREWKKAIDIKRKEAVEPFRKETSRINDKARALTDPLDEIIDIANHKTSRYQKLLLDRRREEEDRLRQQAVLLDIDISDIVTTQTQNASSHSATLCSKTVKKFKVTDLSKVPSKYFVVSEALVEQDMKLGIFDIPGIEIWDETTTSLRIK